MALSPRATGFASDSFLGNRLERVRFELQLHPVQLKELLILAVPRRSSAR